MNYLHKINTLINCQVSRTQKTRDLISRICKISKYINKTNCIVKEVDNSKVSSLPLTISIRRIVKVSQFDMNISIIPLENCTSQAPEKVSK